MGLIPRTALTGDRADTAPTFVNGRPTAATRSPIAFRASIQPLSTNEVLSLPEGKREREAYRLYTDFQLRAADEANGTAPDHVTIDGKLFEVIAVHRWQNNLINHWKCIVSYIKQGNAV